MYYIVREPESKMSYIKHVENATDETLYKLIKDGFDVKAEYNNETDAKHWTDWYNGDVTYDEHQEFIKSKVTIK